MPTKRTFKSCSHEELAELIWKKLVESRDCEITGYSCASCTTCVEKVQETYCWYWLADLVEKDLKVSFDSENIEAASHPNLKELVGFHTLDNGFTFLGIYAGGDWEIPVFWILYMSPKGLRGYIPQKGNYWNSDTNEAYGNNHVPDNENAFKRFGVEDYNDLKIDQSLVLNDIKENVILTESVAS